MNINYVIESKFEIILDRWYYIFVSIKTTVCIESLMMYKKILLLISFSAFQSNIFSMNTQGHRLEVTIECNEMLKQLDKAGTVLIYYYQGVFNSLGEKNITGHKPSDIIKGIRPGEDDKDMQDFFGSKKPDWYLDTIVAPHYNALDKAFDEYFQKTNNAEESWKWFGKHFENEAIKKSFGAYKTKLALENSILLNLRRAQQSQNRTYRSPDGASLFFGQSMEEFLTQKIEAETKKGN